MGRVPTPEPSVVRTPVRGAMIGRDPAVRRAEMTAPPAGTTDRGPEEMIDRERHADGNRTVEMIGGILDRDRGTAGPADRVETAMIAAHPVHREVGATIGVVRRRAVEEVRTASAIEVGRRDETIAVRRVAGTDPGPGIDDRAVDLRGDPREEDGRGELAMEALPGTGVRDRVGRVATTTGVPTTGAAVLDGTRPDGVDRRGEGRDTMARDTMARDTAAAPGRVVLDAMVPVEGVRRGAVPDGARREEADRARVARVAMLDGVARAATAERLDGPRTSGASAAVGGASGTSGIAAPRPERAISR